MADKQTDLVRASGLWEKESKSGDSYLSGQISEAIPAGARIMIFPNTKKEEGSTQPDHTLCYALADEDATKPAKRETSGARRY